MRTLLSLLAALAGPALAGQAPEDGCVRSSGSEVRPLIELYTSEGCSSCPPADRWLSVQRETIDASLLAFHVDYWDALGWPDRFASAAHSLRQRQRVAAVGGRTVYTPQLMIGADVQVHWQAENAWKQALARAQGEAALDLVLRMQPGSDRWRVEVRARPRSAIPKGSRLWLARHLDAQASDVMAGENAGKRLEHERVVVDLWGPWALDESNAPQAGTSQSLEVREIEGPWGLTAFAQAPDGRTLQSLVLERTACGPGP